MSGTPSTSNAANARPHGGDGKFIPTIDTAIRDSKACTLRRDGYTYEEIAKELGYADRGAAHAAVQRAMLAVVKDAAEDLRTLELERLDVLWKRTLEVFHRRHNLVQLGKVVTTMDDNGNVIKLQDDMPVLAAVDRLLKIQERRAKLLGLDAPKQLEIITLDAIQAEIRRIEDEMAAREKAVESVSG